MNKAGTKAALAGAVAVGVGWAALTYAGAGQPPTVAPPAPAGSNEYVMEIYASWHPDVKAAIHWSVGINRGADAVIDSSPFHITTRGQRGDLVLISVVAVPQAGDVACFIKPVGAPDPTREPFRVLRRDGAAVCRRPIGE